MINEVLEVQEYLKGQNIRKKECTFRMCYLLAQYFLAQNLEPSEIRQAIFKWANGLGIYIKQNLNNIIKLVIKDKKPLFDGKIYISKEDIQEIKNKADSKNVRLCALALLLYSKAYADEDGLFDFSQIDFSRWLGISQPHLSEYFLELEMFDYLERVCPEKDRYYFWNGNLMNTKNRYKIKIKYENKGEYLVEDNNIRNLYEKLFDKNIND